MEIEKKSFIKYLSSSLRSRMSLETWNEFDSKENFVKVSFLVQRTTALKEIQCGVATELERNIDEETDEDILRNLQHGWDFRKNKHKALRLKTAGNQAFGLGDNEKSLELYSYAIGFMDPAEKIDLAILYANRSAALFHLSEFSLAQSDINSALELNYPPELHYKLYERSGKCFLQEAKNPEASRRFQQAINSLSQPMVNLDEEKKAKIKSQLEKLLKTSSGSGFGFICNNKEVTNGSSVQYPGTSGGKGRHLRNASPKLSLMKSDVEGRYIVANENIQPGEIIVVEKAYVSALTPEAYYNQCFQCFTLLRAPVPCQNCALVSYCSKKCRDLAWLTHHQHECDILGILKYGGISITCLMALRVLTQNGLPEIRKWGDLLSNPEVDDVPEVKPKVNQGNWRDHQFQFQDEYRADHISSLLKLVTHSSQRSSEDYFHRIIVALFMVLLLRTRTKFFNSTNSSSSSSAFFKKSDTNEEMNNDARALVENGELEKAPLCPDAAEKEMDEEAMIFLSSILMRILQTLQFNAHEIAGWDPTVTKSCFIGGGLFPTLAFFNHSCNPAIVRYFINDTVVVRTVRTIQRGEPVTENYGPVFTQTPREERQKYLKSRYWFDCSCVACIDDWPLFGNLSRDNLYFRCSNCRAYLCKTTTESFNLLLRCARCLKPTNMLQSLKSLEKSEGKFNQAMEFIKGGRLETAVGILVENMKLFDSILLPPFQDYHSCQEGLRKCYLPLGNQSKYSKVRQAGEQDGNNDEHGDGAIVVE